MQCCGCGLGRGVTQLKRCDIPIRCDLVRLGQSRIGVLGCFPCHRYGAGGHFGQRVLRGVGGRDDGAALPYENPQADIGRQRRAAYGHSIGCVCACGFGSVEKLRGQRIKGLCHRTLLIKG